MPRISIVIPTNRPADFVRPCLDAIGRMSFEPASVEVFVVFNGVEPPAATLDGRWPFKLHVASVPQANICAAKNVALERASGEWLLFINDDTYVEPDFARAHLAAHAALDRPAMVVGLAEWQRYEDETIFDRMIQSTSMVFFYDRMREPGWFGFRHAWNLNLSVHRRYVEQERFCEAIEPVYFDDLEFAWRLEQRHGLRVWFAPQARNVHDHRYTLESYLRREGAVGRAAARLGQSNPACFRAIYGSELDADYLDYCSAFVEREVRNERELLATLESIVRRPAATLVGDAEMQAAWIRSLYHAHLPLKRLAFRRGLLEAAAGGAAEAGGAAGSAGAAGASANARAAPPRLWDVIPSRRAELSSISAGR